MEQQFRTTEERMSPVEAEEVLRRFRDEEEARQKEMEAQATNPTVADLAEGLGVSQDRIALLLAQVRRDNVPPSFRSQAITTEQAAIEVQRQNKSAWAIAALVIFGLVFFGIVASMLLITRTTAIAPGAPPIETPAPDTPLPPPGTPAPEANP